MSTPTQSYFDPNAVETKQRIQNLQNNFKLKFFFLTKLPSLLWWGVYVTSCSHLRTDLTLPYDWRTQNPFKSIYFAAQTGAGEFATGMLALIAMQDRKDVSMLVIHQEAKFFKKANSTITFTCEDGAAVIDTIQKALETGEGHTLTMTATGRNDKGETVSEIKITWSFKKKTKR